VIAVLWQPPDNFEISPEMIARNTAAIACWRGVAALQELRNSTKSFGGSGGPVGRVTWAFVLATTTLVSQRLSSVGRWRRSLAHGTLTTHGNPGREAEEIVSSTKASWLPRGRRNLQHSPTSQQLLATALGKVSNTGPSAVSAFSMFFTCNFWRVHRHL